jgi:predicted transcriptional regulator
VGVEYLKNAVPPSPCEMAVRVVLPSLRALVARELTSTHSLKQEDIASALGVTQSAISQYVRSLRGHTLSLGDVDAIRVIVQGIAQGIVKGDMSAAYINREYCRACRIVRESRLLCGFHKRIEPDFEADGCSACLPSSAPCP